MGIAAIVCVLLYVIVVCLGKRRHVDDMRLSGEFQERLEEQAAQPEEEKKIPEPEDPG